MSEDKKYPKASQGIAGLLNIKPDEAPPTVAAEVESMSDTQTGSESMFAAKTAPAPGDLPVAGLPIEPSFDAENLGAETNSKEEPIKPLEESVPRTFDPVDLEALAEENQPTQTANKAWILAKSVLPYVVIFAIGLGLFFYYFSDFSFMSLINSDKLKIESVANEETNKNLEQLKSDVSSDYKKWIAQFFADVNDESIVAMDADVSGNGLSNLEKYLLNLNPKVYSTRGNLGDGEAVIAGINPWTGKPFSDKQKTLMDKYINPELISNRITAAAITRGVTKYAQYVNTDSPYYIDPASLARGTSSPIVEPVIVSNEGSGQNSTEPTTTNTSTQPATIPGADNSGNLNIFGDQAIDLSKPGRLEIPANKISVPIVWTRDVKDFDRDLKKGLVHYPGTALPGEVGTSYISGHSSGYAWDKSPYKQIFASLGSVADGTSFSITATQKNGKTVKFSYVVERRGEFAANDQSQFLSTADSVVALSTCWPVGTVDRRLVLFAKLSQTERN